MAWRRIFAVLVAASAIAALSDAAGAAGRLPNFVIIFTDDMGYADIGPFGAKGYETPQLDRLAKEGRRFTHFYVPQSICSASRAGLLTGCYNTRVGIQAWLGADSDHGLSASEMTLPEVVKQKGYATACFGKWHVGHHPKFLPTSHGFDEFVGLPWANNMKPLPLMEGTRVIKPELTVADHDQLTTLFTERSVEFIQKHKDQPFLLYMAHTMPHIPLNVSEKVRGKSGAGLLGDVMLEIDWSTGKIVDALRDNGLERDTFVLFTSDNGPWLSFGNHAGSAGPLREGKGSTFEGGVRMPTIMWWPGKIPAGTACETPAMTIDILPTIAHLVGAKLPDHKIDGKDIWPLIAGEPGAESPHEAYYFYFGNRQVRPELQAIRMGRWKLHFPHHYATLSGRPGGKDGKRAPEDWVHTNMALYDLENDPGETRNVLQQHPQVVAKIEALADRMRADLGDSFTGQEGAGVREPGRLQPGDLRFDWDPKKPIVAEPTRQP